MSFKNPLMDDFLPPYEAVPQPGVTVLQPKKKCSISWGLLCLLLFVVLIAGSVLATVYWLQISGSSSACPICSSVSPIVPDCPTSPSCPACPQQKTCPVCSRPPIIQKLKSLCEIGWKYYELTDSCYFLGHEKPVNNSEARSLCLQQGADLASIHSQEENNFIIDYTYSKPGVTPDIAWIGLYRSGPKNGTHDFNHYDGTAVGYANWAEGQPDNLNGIEFCAEMCMGTINGYGSWCAGWPRGKWNDVVCSRPLSLYICKKPANK